MENSRLRDAAPTSVNVTVGKLPMPRAVLLGGLDEPLDLPVGEIFTAAATAILVAYRHGLRASELVALRWDDIDLAALSCSQALNGGPATHDHRQKATDIPTAMALFGYPVAQENEAERAVQAAISMPKRLSVIPITLPATEVSVA